MKWGTKEMFNHYVFMIIDEEFKIDIHEKKVTHREIAEVIKDLFFEIKEDEVAGELTNDVVSEFKSRKGTVLSQLLSGSLTEYSLAFPLNLGLIKSEVGKLSALEADFEQVEQDEWINQYFNTAKAEDDGFLAEFLDVSPNDYLEDRFAYYRTKYKARSEGYALSRIQDLANLAVGMLNRCLHQNSRAPPRPHSDTALPYETWAALKEPAFYLVFENDEYLFPRPMDYSYRRVLKANRERRQTASEFESIPNLSEDDPVDSDLINAILAYQDGLTETSERKAFFSFWRGIEILSQVDTPKSEVKERCRFGLEYIRGEDGIFPTLEPAHEEIDDVRNSLAHEGVNIHVGHNHQNYAKVLLDGMIDLYIQERENFDQDDFDTFLEYGVEYQRGAGKIISILQQSGFNTD